MEDRDEDAHGHFSQDLSPEVSTCRVHVVVDFSEEYRSFHWEHKIDVVNSTETVVQAQEEKGTLSVLDSGFVLIDVPVDGQTKEGYENGGSDFNSSSSRKSDLSSDGSLSDQLELVEPGGMLLLLNVLTLDRFHIWINLVWVILELGLLVAVNEEFDPIVILGLKGCHRLQHSFFISLVNLFDFDFH